MRKNISLIIGILLFPNLLLADNLIQEKFWGCTLGKSIRPKVERAMQKHNFELIKQDSVGVSYYKGRYLYAGVEFQDIKIKYSNDTLSYISFGNDFGFRNYEIKNKIQKFLYEKYGDLENADSTLFSIIERNSFETNDIETWSRKSSGLIVACFSTYDYNKCVFSLEPSYSIHYDSAKVAMENLKTYLASYDSVNAVVGVAGIKFGDNIHSARPILQSRSSDVMTSGDQLIGVSTTISGVTYKYSYFTFHRQEGLIKVLLFKEYNYYEKKAAEQQLEDIIQSYKSRYTNFRVNKEEKDEKVYSCGQYMSNYDYPPIFIMFKKVINSSTGEVTYQVAVSYYIHKPDPIYNDEI